MKKPLVLLLCFFSLSAGRAFPLFAAEEALKMNYVCRDLKGAARWRAEALVTNIRPGVYLMVEKVEGVYSGHAGPISWVAKMEFERAIGGVRPLNLDKQVFDARGKLIRRERQEFDPANNTGTCVHEDPGKNIYRVKKFKFDKDVVTRLSMGFYVRRMLESGKTRELVQMVSEEPGVYDVELSVSGKETIEAAGKPTAAYKICIDPQLGAFDVVKVFLPKAYAWHAAGSGYEWLGYTGLEGGINSEKIRVMLE